MRFQVKQNYFKKQNFLFAGSLAVDYRKKTYFTVCRNSLALKYVLTYIVALAKKICMGFEGNLLTAKNLEMGPMPTP
jgi:hypothetical protein